ncbi:hypothetical protein RW115_01265 [Macrococcus capreoli]
MEFKLDLPESCPPIQSIASDLRPVYRLTDSNELKETDFMSHIELGKNYRPEQECQAHAISFFNDIDSCYRAQKKFKNLRNKVVSKGIITKECGLNDSYKGSSHINLWVYKDVNLLDIFLGGDNNEDEI